MAIKILKINDVPATEGEFKKFLSTKYDHWDLIRFTMSDTKTGTTWPRDANIEEATVIVMKQLLLDKGCEPKQLEDFEQAVRDEVWRSSYEGQEEGW
jgi:hypothetical protein